MVNNGCIVKSINLVSLFKIVEAREFELGVSGMLIGIGLGILAVHHKEMKPSYNVRMKYNALPCYSGYESEQSGR